MGWQADHLALYLWTENILNDKEYYKIQALSKEGLEYSSPASVELRRILEDKGYDGVTYPNDYEGDGLSYIVFRDDQIIEREISEYTESVGENNGVSTIYNIGKIKADNIPNGNRIVSERSSKARGILSADGILPQTDEKVNNRDLPSVSRDGIEIKPETDPEIQAKA